MMRKDIKLAIGVACLCVVLFLGLICIGNITTSDKDSDPTYNSQQNQTENGSENTETENTETAETETTETEIENYEA